MGDRYIIVVVCPNCQFKEEEVYYAPTCGFTKWTCPECSKVVNLEKYTGISYEDASNRSEIESIINSMGDK